MSTDCYAGICAKGVPKRYNLWGNDSLLHLPSVKLTSVRLNRTHSSCCFGNTCGAERFVHHPHRFREGAVGSITTHRQGSERFVHPLMTGCFNPSQGAVPIQDFVCRRFSRRKTTSQFVTPSLYIFIPSSSFFSNSFASVFLSEPRQTSSSTGSGSVSEARSARPSAARPSPPAMPGLFSTS